MKPEQHQALLDAINQHGMTVDQFNQFYILALCVGLVVVLALGYLCGVESGK